MSQFTHYLTLGFLWQGLLIAIEISAAAFFAALPFALAMALMRMARNRGRGAVAPAALGARPAPAHHKETGRYE